MFVPLTINGFLELAAAVYPDRVASFDQPAPPLPDLTWRQVATLGHIQGPRVTVMRPAFDGEGYYSITDRKKDVIITGGENVSSIEVEDRLPSHPDLEEAAVIGVPDAKWGETVKALAHCKCPTSVEVRAAPERTATGNLQKFKLREPYWEGHGHRVN